MKVQAVFLKNLLDFSDFHQISTSPLKQLMEDPKVDLEDADAMVPAKDYELIFSRIVQEVQIQSCGLGIGAYLNLSSLGLVLEISLNTSSLKQGIYILEQYLQYKFPIVSFTVLEESSGAILQLESTLKNTKVRKELLNIVLYIIYRELTLMMPKGKIPEVEFPCTAEEKSTYFPSTQVVNHEHHRILLPGNYEELDINTHKVKAVELLFPKFISMLKRERETSRFNENVKTMALMMCNPEVPNLKSVQSQFPISARTFQRRLTTEGTTFRKITNEIKKELSNYLKNEKSLKTKDIAYILGYSEPSAYLHALKSWENKAD